MSNLSCTQADLPTGSIALWHDPDARGLPKILLGHGNGLNSLCQNGLMTALRPYFDVYGMDFRGHGATRLPLPVTPEDPWGWYVCDLQQLIERHFDGYIRFVGHSMAAVTAIRLGLRRPNLFQHITAIDPAILPSTKGRLYPLARKLGLTARVNHLYKGTLSRRHTWPDREAAIDYFTGRKAFATWPTEAVEGYIDGGLKDSGSTLTLSCPRQWEARTFKFVPVEIERRLKDLQVPSLLMRASEGSIFPNALRLNPLTRLHVLAGSHFVHLEHPEAVANLICETLA